MSQADSMVGSIVNMQRPILSYTHKNLQASNVPIIPGGQKDMLDQRLEITTSCKINEILSGYESFGTNTNVRETVLAGERELKSVLDM